eukprot:gb/GEZN01001639.1/.p1 GENE.gb/GEZN01001639.1/~~gb/GEZN01001639.1/.p1  ORF type:complete len:821 (+),score=84.66 gb/GEZN01001639.1/:100-2562(+)
MADGENSSSIALLSRIKSIEGGKINPYQFHRRLSENSARNEAQLWKGDNVKFSWDYCLVFKMPNKEEKKEKKDGDTEEKDTAQQTQEVLDALKTAGLHYRCYLSVQEDELYTLIGITERRLRQEADREDYDLLLNTEEIIAQGKAINLPLCRELGSGTKKNQLLNRKAWRDYYGRYDAFNPQAPDRQKLYVKQKEKNADRSPDTFFRSMDRLRIMLIIMETSTALGGAGLPLFTMKRDPKCPLMHCFPLHDEGTREALETKWMKFWPLFDQPLPEIRDYFGEKVAFYFAFLQYYCIWLAIPALLGLIVFAQQITSGFAVDVESLPLMGVGVALWASLFLEFWKRREATLRCDWGMTNFVVKEPTRAEFQGTLQRDPRNGELIFYFQWYERFVRVVQSQTVIWGLIVAVLSLVVGIFFIRNLLIREMGKGKENDARYLTSFINFIQIQVMNTVYGMVAVKLNDYENHQTASAYENALIFKSFLFKFINCYNSFFYIAFFKQFDEKAGRCKPPEGHCLPELQIQLVIVFGSTIVVSNTLELLLPFLKNLWVAYSNRGKSETGELLKKSPPEEQAEFEPYTTFADFDELAVQFGYVSLFVVAFPMAPAMALANNYFEIRIDAHKILRLSQRPSPLGAARIGTWFDIFTVVSFVAVLVNTIICVFYTSVIDRVTDGNWQTKAIIFVASEHIILLLKIGISYAVADIPQPVQDQIDRQEFLVDVLIEGTAFDDDLVDLKEVSQTVDESSKKELRSFDYTSVKRNYEELVHPSSAPAVEVVHDSGTGPLRESEMNNTPGPDPATPINPQRTMSDAEMAEPSQVMEP